MSARENAETVRDHQRQTERELREAERLRDTEPGRWGDSASPARMRRDRLRDRLEDEELRGWR